MIEKGCELFMNAKVLNWFFFLFWVGICAALLTREFWMPPDMLDRVSGPRTPLVIAFVVLLVLWRGMRLWVDYQFGGPPKESPRVTEYRRRIRAITGEDPKVTNPEFVFDDPPKDETQRSAP
jgi:hypothetical protein